ncbi:hypothetical protein SeMB42_g06752 [Synchytrium endobioticum]|uniref:Uncharacterized protein n=1 Tax=Synchytrium endobioticum TaxID=286115 RepID=A0A507CKP0_9FUNG|nr:hypothetical protein SeLEV6574_g07834 [Synchytrium endobioticum]TPX38413.1 hypothetical protein SeMB42_g06752 [Synchytrium endobioticum]
MSATTVIPAGKPVKPDSYRYRIYYLIMDAFDNCLWGLVILIIFIICIMGYHYYTQRTSASSLDSAALKYFETDPTEWDYTDYILHVISLLSPSQLRTLYFILLREQLNRAYLHSLEILSRYDINETQIDGLLSGTAAQRVHTARRLLQECREYPPIMHISSYVWLEIVPCVVHNKIAREETVSKTDKEDSAKINWIELSGSVYRTWEASNPYDDVRCFTSWKRNDGYVQK